MELLLASSSPYRRQLLTQLGLEFDWHSPRIDESQLEGESPSHYVARLGRQKAQVLRAQYPNHWIIGSDQTCVLDGECLGKPGNRDNAIAQLKRCQGKSVEFLTSVCLLSPSGNSFQAVEPFRVEFRDLPEAEISHYVDCEQPFDCAGSFKVEGLGIHLFSALSGRDHNSLIGLPLIALLNLMREAGLAPLTSAKTR